MKLIYTDKLFIIPAPFIRDTSKDSLVAVMLTMVVRTLRGGARLLYLERRR